jgi:ubiquinone/menaquinone biosynthesis C-methylase UbiE
VFRAPTDRDYGRTPGPGDGRAHVTVLLPLVLPPVDMAEMNRCSRWVVNHLKSRANARLYAWLARNLTLPPGAVCLEVGCGNGNMAVRIMDGMSPARLVATDLDLVQIGAAERLLREHYPEGRPSGLELRPADMTRLPFPDAGFDVVFAFATLHHASASHRDPSGMPRALAEVDRVLRPSGFVAIEEFLHKDLLVAWLRSHGYTFLSDDRRWRREMLVAQKPPPPPGVAAEPPN